MITRAVFPAAFLIWDYSLSFDKRDLIMRLVNKMMLRLEEFNGNQIPEYAILSHTWDEE
jgi:hypothetical protein